MQQLYSSRVVNLCSSFPTIMNDELFEAFIYRNLTKWRGSRHQLNDGRTDTTYLTSQTSFVISWLNVHKAVHYLVDRWVNGCVCFWSILREEHRKTTDNVQGNTDLIQLSVHSRVLLDYVLVLPDCDRPQLAILYEPRLTIYTMITLLYEPSLTIYTMIT